MQKVFHSSKLNMIITAIFSGMACLFLLFLTTGIFVEFFKNVYGNPLMEKEFILIYGVHFYSGFGFLFILLPLLAFYSFIFLKSILDPHEISISADNNLIIFKSLFSSKSKNISKISIIEDTPYISKSISDKFIIYFDDECIRVVSFKNIDELFKIIKKLNPKVEFIYLNFRNYNF